MATTERAQEFMDDLRLVTMDQFCDLPDCHGTHVDFVDWELARRRLEESGTLEMMTELDDSDRKLMLWAAYVLYAFQRYCGRPMTPPPPSSRPTVLVPKDLRESGFLLENVCWACSSPNCAVCVTPEGCDRLQHIVIFERKRQRVGSYLNNHQLMLDFFRDIFGVDLEADDALIDG